MCKSTYRLCFESKAERQRFLWIHGQRQQRCRTTTEREREWKTERTGIYLIVLNPHLSPTLNPQHSSLLLRHSPSVVNAPPRVRYYQGYRRGQSNNATGCAISTREGKASQWQTTLRCFLFQLGKMEEWRFKFYFFHRWWYGGALCNSSPLKLGKEEMIGRSPAPGNSRRGRERDCCLVKLRFKRLWFQIQCLALCRFASNVFSMFYFYMGLIVSATLRCRDGVGMLGQGHPIKTCMLK
jgi:hypothetical protein